jgi:electron transport complex protein RnfG
MKEIIRITLGLTVSCLIAASVMGTVFAITDKAKKHNEHENVQQTMFALLGYGKSNPAPLDLKLHAIYRYIIENPETKRLGYMIPVTKGDKTTYELIIISLKGEFVQRLPLDIPSEKVSESAERASALKSALKPGRKPIYADRTVVAKEGSDRVAYLLPGEFPGFKTFIKVMLAVDPDFQILGLEIMEHEEDPGLGGEIEQEYFKNQFKDKSFAKLKDLKVIKEPLPVEYKRWLETKKREEGLMTKAEINAIKQKYKDADIYALTGATISSRAVTVGTKNIIKRFAYRLEVLDQVLAKQNISAAF